SRSPNSTLPAEGGNSPLMMLNSVVLPAPFGPMIARRSPGSTENVTFLSTSSPAKFLQTCCRLRSATPDPSPDTHDSAAHEQHKHHKQRAQNQLPPPGEQRGQHVLQHHVRGGTEDRADQRGFAAEQNHQHRRTRD